MFKRLFRYFLNRVLIKKTIDIKKELQKTKNLVVGNKTTLDGLNIFYYELSNNYNNIKIGDTCLLENNCTLYNKDSKISIGNRVYLGPNTNINCYLEIEIGDDVMFAWGCTVMDTNAHSLIWQQRINDVMDWKKGWSAKDWSNVESKKIKIGNKCWVGFNSIILKGVELGEGCVVAAGSVVTKNFPPYSVIGGNPAILIKITQ